MAAPTAEYAGWRLALFVGLFTPLQVAAVALRFYARTLTARPYSADDWLIVASLASQLVMAGAAIGGMKQGGIGYHADYVAETDPAAITRFLQYLVFYSVWFAVTFLLPKLAVLVRYRHLFPGRPVHIVTSVTGAALVAAAIAMLIVLLVACRPFDANWGPPAVQAAYCMDKETLFIWSSFPNILTDVIILVLPLCIVWKLHTPLRLKVGLTATFMVGSMGLIASILRLRTFINNPSFNDVTYTAVELLIWTLAELGLYLISACLLMCRPLLDKFLGGARAATLRVTSSKGGTSRSGVAARAGAYYHPSESESSSALASSRTHATGLRSVSTVDADMMPRGSIAAQRGDKLEPTMTNWGGDYNHTHGVGGYAAYPLESIVVTTHLDQSWSQEERGPFPRSPPACGRAGRF